jgi:drug/metabolite transporter (DMT)-like permease
VLRTLDPLALAGLRVAIAAPTLLSLATIIERTLPRWRDQLRLAVLGLFGVFSNQLLFILGLRHTTAANAGILMPSIPAFAVLVATLLRVEKVTPGRLGGVLLSVAGAVVLLRPHRFTLESGTVLGNLLVLSNCLCYAVFLVLQRPVLQRLPFLTVIAWAFLWGGAGVLAVSLPSLVAVPFGELGPALWAQLTYVVVAASLLAYPLNTWAIRRSSSVMAAAYTTLQPLGTATLAALLLGERLGWVEAVAGALIVAGLWQVSRSRQVG